MSGKMVFRVNPDKMELSPSKFIATEDIVDGTPQESAKTIFEGSSGDLQLGVWECTPYAEAVDLYGVDEFCTLLTGQVSFIDNAGHKETYKAGESYLVRKAFSGTFRVEKPTRKLYVIFEREQ